MDKNDTNYNNQPAMPAGSRNTSDNSNSHFEELLDGIKNNSIEHLDLSDNKIGDAEAIALAAALAENTSVTSINLERNRIGDEGAISLAKVLAENTSVTSINLSGSMLWRGITDEGARALADALKINRSLTSLSLSKNRIGNEGVTALAAALAENENTLLKSINLSDNNKIGDEGAAALAGTLVTNTSLKNIILTGTYLGMSISDEGARALADALKINRSLTGLSLGGTRRIGKKIGNKGAAYLAAGLAENTSLTGIDLSNHEIDAYGAGCLAAALAENKNTSLASIDLSDNKIDADGAAYLATGLAENTSVTSLNLNGNPVKVMLSNRRTEKWKPSDDKNSYGRLLLAKYRRTREREPSGDKNYATLQLQLLEGYLQRNINLIELERKNQMEDAVIAVVKEIYCNANNNKDLHFPFELSVEEIGKYLSPQEKARLREVCRAAAGLEDPQAIAAVEVVQSTFTSSETTPEHSVNRQSN